MSGSRFRVHNFSGTRQVPATNVNGEWVPNPGSVINFDCSKQNPTGKDLLTLPEGRREKETHILFTDFELKTIDEEANINPDIIDIDGGKFEVMNVEAWQNKVIPHYRVIVSKINV